MLLDGSSPLSGYIKLLFLALAVLVVLTQASPDGWARKCGYGTGRCRKHCKENEKKKEKCGLRKVCCIPAKQDKVAHSAIKWPDDGRIPMRRCRQYRPGDKVCSKVF
ncbi:beta-defensin 115-like [Eubalaena glacialis]|uniref:beta-defensin 115-like n=1 Tax=Eubalaena glacialis TaxID=27606 RepID=UPI002A5B01C7|nr:beta-defensin 115-like [Eubalaena glacialis]